MTQPIVTVLAAATGAADTAQFLGSRPQLFRDAPGRAGGTAAGLALWLALAGVAATEGERSGAASLALSSALVAGNLAILGMHLRHRIAGPRVFLGVAASAVALADVLRRR